MFNKISIVLKRVNKGLEVIKEYKKYKNSTEREIILFGSPIHGNIGDHAITIAEYKLLKDININNIFEISSFERYIAIDYISKKISNNAIIVINGGGFMGSQWIKEEMMIRDVIKHFPNNRIVIFPQTAFYKDDENGKKIFEESYKIYNSHKNLVLCAREERTYNFFVNTYKKAQILYLPDIVLYLDRKEYCEKKNGCLLCLRNDPEKNSNNEKIIAKTIDILKGKFNKIETTDTVVSFDIDSKKREEEFNKKLKEFSKYQIIVTDRLHGMIFSFLTKTPCIVFGNYNYKVEGVYQWIKNCNNIVFIKDEKDLIKIMEFKENNDDFIVDKSLFDKLKNVFNLGEKNERQI